MSKLTDPTMKEERGGREEIEEMEEKGEIEVKEEKEEIEGIEAIEEIEVIEVIGDTEVIEETGEIGEIEVIAEGEVGTETTDNLDNRAAVVVDVIVLIKIRDKRRYMWIK